MNRLKNAIESSFRQYSSSPFYDPDASARQAIAEAIESLDQGRLTVSKKRRGKWITREWVKKAILLFFFVQRNRHFRQGETHFFDKIPTKFDGWNRSDFEESGIRVVPPATVRKGAYVGKNTLLMPSYVNIGAYVGSGSTIDTWSTVGSCAHVGKNVHISGGVGIGGVLEPIQAHPTIIEDDCFIGARSEIVEGVLVEKGSVISMGVFVGRSTRIFDRTTRTVSYGRIPSGSVVVSGSLPSQDTGCSLYCAVIVKRVDAKTQKKTRMNPFLHTDS